MTLSEFKFWLEGFTESITDAPTKEQWAKIQSRIDDVKPDTVYPIQDLKIPDYLGTPKPDNFPYIVTCDHTTAGPRLKAS